MPRRVVEKVATHMHSPISIRMYVFAAGVIAIALLFTSDRLNREADLVRFEQWKEVVFLQQQRQKATEEKLEVIDQSLESKEDMIARWEAATERFLEKTDVGRLSREVAALKEEIAKLARKRRVPRRKPVAKKRPCKPTTETVYTTRKFGSGATMTIKEVRPKCQ